MQASIDGGETFVEVDVPRTKNELQKTIDKIQEQ